MAIKIIKMPDFATLIKTVQATDQRIASVATFIITGISKRTQRGLDFNNRTFKAYNSDYKQYRASQGRSKRVNLTFNNQMLNAMRFKKIKDGVMIYFPDSVENEKAYNNQEENGRKFFGLDTNQEKYIISSIGKYISQGFK